jgi:cellulose synthase/poly-beta-1,6-N-acetylglucosamine synthase-like glycosyltransferase
MKILLGDYPVTQQFKTRAERFDFEQFPGPVAQQFKRVVRNLEFDVSEMAIMTFLIAKAHGKPYRLLPAVVGYQFDGSGPVTRPPYGANMAYRREMFERYGLFRTDLGPRGREMIRGEDTEFGLRLLAGGERVLYVPGAIVYRPVEPERMRLRYFEQYYFGEGRMQIRAFPLPPGTVRWLGIPRYCYRGFVEHLFKWGTSLNPRARAFHRLSGWMVLGNMFEAWRQGRQ